MSKVFVQKGDVVTVVSPSGGVSSGDPVMISDLFGVALHDAAEAAALEIGVEGIFNLPKDSNLIIAQGDRVFWDSTNGWVDKTTTSQVCVGRAVEGKDTAVTPIAVKLGPATPAE
jgi:predicted RecA/RadA family phage recombinase